MALLRIYLALCPGINSGEVLGHHFLRWGLSPFKYDQEKNLPCNTISQALLEDIQSVQNIPNTHYIYNILKHIIKHLNENIIVLFIMYKFKSSLE